MHTTTIWNFLTKKDILSALPKTQRPVEDLSYNELLNKVINLLANNELSSNTLRKLWNKAITQMFFHSYQKVFIFTPSQKYQASTQLKKMLQSKTEQIEKSLKQKIRGFYTTKLSSNPLHFAVTMTIGEIEGFSQLFPLPLNKIISLHIFPSLGVATYCNNNSIEEVKFIMKLINSVFSNSAEIKVNALLLRKYSTTEHVKKLVISTPQEIAGFTGLDHIIFEGEDVMLGLLGLKRRHDANVDVITRVGPYSELESETLKLICGKGIIIKSYKGLDNLLSVIKTA
ncbi:MAG: hypothetical protein ACTSYD_01255 [Candidatus Heimdallarchaeaceae archaeon]